MFNYFFIKPNFLDDLIKKTHIIILSIYFPFGRLIVRFFLQLLPAFRSKLRQRRKLSTAIGAATLSGEFLLN